MEATLGQNKVEFWRQRIEVQRISGQSVRAWCLANDVGEHSFYYWRVRLGLSSGKGRRRKPSPTGFVRALVVDRPVASAVEPLRLRLSGERELILPASTPMSQVAELLMALERCS